MQTSPIRTTNRGTLLVLILLAGVLVAGVAGYLAGRMQAQNELVSQATLRIQVENRFSTSQSFDILVNDKLKGTLSVAAGQTGTMDVMVAFSPGDGAWFEIVARNATGQADADMLLLTGPGTYIVQLRVSP